MICTDYLLWALLVPCGVSGTNEGQLCGGVPVRELERGIAVTANFVLNHCPILDLSIHCGRWELHAGATRDAEQGTAGSGM